MEILWYLLVASTALYSVKYILTKLYHRSTKYITQESMGPEVSDGCGNKIAIGVIVFIVISLAFQSELLDVIGERFFGVTP